MKLRKVNDKTVFSHQGYGDLTLALVGMKRQALSILLLLALLNPLAFKVGVVLHWKYNQREIAQTICENRNKPQLHCNGKCKLVKQLQKIDNQKESEKAPPTEVTKMPKLDHYILARKPALPVDFVGAFLTASPYAHAWMLYRADYIHTIFHPPQA